MHLHVTFSFQGSRWEGGGHFLQAIAIRLRPQSVGEKVKYDLFSYIKQLRPETGSGSHSEWKFNAFLTQQRLSKAIRHWSLLSKTCQGYSTGTKGKKQQSVAVVVCASFLFSLCKCNCQDLIVNIWNVLWQSCHVWNVIHSKCRNIVTETMEFQWPWLCQVGVMALSGAQNAGTTPDLPTTVLESSRHCAVYFILFHLIMQ